MCKWFIDLLKVSLTHEFIGLLYKIELGELSIEDKTPIRGHDFDTFRFLYYNIMISHD